MSIKSLISEIQNAFEGVKLDGGISLNMAEYADSYEYDKECLKRAANDEKENWQNISSEDIENCTVTFCFTDLRGFKFYIPAYMCWALRNFDKSHSCSIDSTIYAIDPDHFIFKETPFNELFNSQQIKALCSFLEFAINNGDFFDDIVANKNLKKIRILLKN
ncbi:DUF6714 family protein [Vacuolonema iberomarrocanum]|uniref:DUF6714 family protein n=1 Tax=Vacuolonema iberomarrocanum TaxID=3454632 RepID=UPI0019E7F900|nr:hypothetical protein [filamentous cyanobacterium LEGE 07170]